MSARKLTRQDLRDAAEKYKNWGKWGPADEIGTLNFTQPEDIVAAARLVRKGKVISLALNFDNSGPQGAKASSEAARRREAFLRNRGLMSADGRSKLAWRDWTKWGR